MKRRHDMGTLYDDHMAFFGLGTALFHPNSASDMRPPCVGYLDASRRWNHICNVPFPDEPSVYLPLEKKPQKMAELKIEWRPKTSLGVRQYTVAAQGETPDGLPAGAAAAVRYSSKTNFGAILITQKPVTLTSYNDETLFRHWINHNYSTLAQLHGVELSRYGLWLVTRTYTTPKASINAWQSKDKDAVLSVKAKADMVGDLGASLDWSERGNDKDWTHHAAPEGVVAFFDGIEIPGWQWWYAGFKARVRKNLGLARRVAPRSGILGPRGSFKPSKLGPANPKDPPAAPGADDAWILKSSPVLKENKKLITDMMDEKQNTAETQSNNLKASNGDPGKHLSMASTAHGNSNTDTEGKDDEEPEKLSADDGSPKPAAASN